MSIKDWAHSWVTIEAGTNKMVCQRCGMAIIPVLPMPITQVLELGKMYGKLHALCKEQPVWGQP